MLSKTWYRLIFTSPIFSFFVTFCTTAPVVETPYSAFVNYLNVNNCSIPDQILAPFLPTEKESGPFYSSLMVCRKPDYINTNKEAPIICGEILNILQNIWCLNGSMNLPEIKVTFSAQMCNDFTSLKAMLPKNKLQHLADTDVFFCDLMCANEFEPACQVLLWGYKVWIQIEDAFKNAQNQGQEENVQENELKSNDANKHEKITVVAPIQTETNSGISTTGKPLVVEQKKTGINQPNKEDATIEGTKGVVPEKQVDKKVTASSTQTESQQLATANQKSEHALPESKEAAKKIMAIPTIPKTADNDTTSNELPPSPVGNINPPNSQENEIDDKPEIASKKNPSNAQKVDSQLTADVPTDAQPKQSAKVLPPEETNELPEEPEIEAQSQETNVNKVAAKDNQENHVPAAEDNGEGNIMTNEKESLHESKKIEENKPIDEEQSAEPPVPTVSKATSKSAAEEYSVVQFTAPESTNVELYEIPKPTEVAVLEKMEGGGGPADKEDPDQYSDLENGEGDTGEYPKQEYDGGIYEPLKNKESNSDGVYTEDSPKESVVLPNEISKTYNEFPPRNSFGHVPQDIQVIAPFPEQEDSHFFFYFLSIVLIVMAGYLLFHNKQKIIALIVEGRHERRRRSHGVGYKKLETK